MDPQQHLDRVIALAGIYQATSLVQQVAREGCIDSEPFKTSIASLFKVDSASTESVYGGGASLKRGLETLCNQLGRSKRDVELTRYTVCLLFLERKLSRRRDHMRNILKAIETATTQAEYFSFTHECVLAKLADVYVRTVSTMSPRIMVTGTPQYLNNSDNANRIRALLLAGLRSTVLWRQLGGNRLQLLFSRNRIVNSAQTILTELEA